MRARVHRQERSVQQNESGAPQAGASESPYGEQFHTGRLIVFTIVAVVVFALGFVFLN
jgi:hypothetical protein